jgi:hypothetical protein
MKSKIFSKSNVLLSHAAFLQISSYIARPAAIYRAIELDINPAYIGAMAISFSILPLLLSVFVANRVKLLPLGNQIWTTHLECTHLLAQSDSQLGQLYC